MYLHWHLNIVSGFLKENLQFCEGFGPSNRMNHHRQTFFCLLSARWNFHLLIWLSLHIPVALYTCCIPCVYFIGCVNTIFCLIEHFVTYKLPDTYLLTHSLTHSMVLDIILKADSYSACQKIACLLSLWNLKVHYHVNKRLPLDPILSQLNPVCPIDPYLPKVHHILFQLLRSCQRIIPGPRYFETFCNKWNFYGEGLLAPCPLPDMLSHLSMLLVQELLVWTKHGQCHTTSLSFPTGQYHKWA
jgi:hypothetical protein